MKLAVEGSNVIINCSRRRSVAVLTAQEARNRGVTAHIVKAKEIANIVVFLCSD